MRFFSFLILIALVTSCDPPSSMENPDFPSRQSLVNEVTNKTIVKLKTESNLRACGIGSGMMNQIRMLAISFYYYNEVDVEEARELLMTAGMTFLNTINSNEKIHPFLQNHPFMPNNIQIAIFLRNPDGSSPDIDKLSVISMTNGMLTYRTHHSSNGRLSTVFEETFEEAQAKLNGDIVPIAKRNAPISRKNQQDFERPGLS
ncbi:MAG: hypothetical protein V4492_02475 [Chlamydiota bacterium]